MSKILIVLIAVAMLFTASYSFAAWDYESELAQEQKGLKKLDAEIAQLKKKFNKIKADYVKADMKLRQELQRQKKTLADTGGDKDMHKTLVTDGKKKQAALRADYYAKKDPLSKKLHQVKIQHRDTRRKIKILERKIKRISEGYADDSKYIEEIEGLKEKLADERKSYEVSLENLESETDDKLASLIGKEQKEADRKQILTDAKAKKVDLLKAYSAKKAALKAKIREAQKAQRTLVQKNRQKKMAERAKKSRETVHAQKAKVPEDTAAAGAPACNFGPKG